MKCPTCRRPADNQAAACTRCGTNLELLTELEAEHDRLIRRGNNLLQHQLPKEAREQFLRAQGIRRTSPHAEKGLALAELIRKDFSAALDHHAAARSLQDSPSEA